jgi:hypothetical protein
MDMLSIIAVIWMPVVLTVYIIIDLVYKNKDKKK